MPIDLADRDRRVFLQRTAAGGAAFLVGSSLSRPAAAIEPIRRTDEPHFKFSLAAYSYRKLLSGKSPELTLTDFIEDCAAMGLDGTELTSYYFPPQPEPAYFRQLKGEAFRRGLDVSGTAVGNDFCHPPGVKRQQQIEYVRRWIEYADLMDAPVIRIFSGNAKQGVDAEKAHRLAVEGIEECCEYAGRHGVFLALENHGGLTSTVDGMLALVRDVKSPWFGVNVDTGNFHSETIYEDLARIAPLALNVQVKVVIRPAGGKKEPTDFKRLAGIFRDSGYRGYIVLEYEEGEDPRKACPEFVKQLREAFA